MSELLVIDAVCATCTYWRKIKQMPHGTCELYRAKGIQDEKPHYENGDLIVNARVNQVFLIVMSDRAVCSEWEIKP